MIGMRIRQLGSLDYIKRVLCYDRMVFCSTQWHGLWNIIVISSFMGTSYGTLL